MSYFIDLQSIFGTTIGGRTVAYPLKQIFERNFQMNMRTVGVAVMSLVLLGGCSASGRSMAGIAGGAIAGQLILEAMKGNTPSAGGGGSSAKGYEGCSSPEVLRSYFAQTRAAHPGALGWGGLSGGVDTIRQHCRLYQSMQPLMNEQCVGVGYSQPACPFLADDSVRVWSIGRQPSIGTGLLL